MQFEKQKQLLLQTYLSLLGIEITDKDELNRLLSLFEYMLWKYL
jgi:hypothetical protein